MKTPDRPREDHRVLLDHTSWETYERLVAEREERPVPRFFYEKGVLEIVSPSTAREVTSRLCALAIELLGEEWGYDVLDAGHTTFRRQDLQQGFEPDGASYFSAASRLRGKYNLDLGVGPPPELVVEVDLTSSSLDKLPIYARIGVGEVWRYDGESVEILTLTGGGYESSATSGVLPPVTGDVLSRFVEEGKTLRSPEWMGKVRQWARHQ